MKTQCVGDKLLLFVFLLDKQENGSRLIFLNQISLLSVFIRVGPFGKSCQHRPASLTLAVDSPPEHFEPNWRSVGACAILRQASKVLAS